MHGVWRLGSPTQGHVGVPPQTPLLFKQEGPPGVRAAADVWERARSPGSGSVFAPGAAPGVPRAAGAQE